MGEQKTKAQVLVGFAAETENMVENARRKLQSKNLDIVVANDVTAEGAGFGADTNIAVLILRDQEISLEKMSKRELADRILDEALEMIRAATERLN